MSIYTDVFANVWTKIKSVFHTDIEPVLESFLSQFATDEGKLILTTAISAAPALATGNFGAVAADVLASVVNESKVLAAQDATKTLQQVQSALQIAKVAQNITTPGDQNLLSNAPVGTAGAAA